MRLHEIRSGKNIQVKGKCGPRQLHLTGDGSNRQTIRSVFDQEAKDVQAGLLRECAERVECTRCIHNFGTMDIIRNSEACQIRGLERGKNRLAGSEATAYTLRFRVPSRN